MVEYTFRRYVNGKEMAEGVSITKAASLDEAMRNAVAMCPERGTVLVLDNAYSSGRAEAFEEAAKIADKCVTSDLDYARRYPDEAIKMEERAHRADTIAAAIRALANEPPK